VTAAPILLVGSVALDDLHTPSGSRHEAFGGSASYFALAARFFAPVRLVAVVGDDFPPAYREVLAGAGVDLEGLEIAPGPCFRWGGRYGEDLNTRETLFTHLGVFEHFHPKVPDAYRGSDFVFLGNIHPSLQQEVLRQVRAPRLVVLDTMNLWIETARAELLDVLASVDVLIVNDAEARQLTGESNLVRAGRALLALGPTRAVIKKGEHGAALFAPGGIFALPAVPLERVVDPTGAGDSFAGGLLGSLAAEGECTDRAMRRAMALGSVLASLTVEDFGLERLRTASRREIAARYEELRHMTHFDAAPPVTGA
jgi:sugar/nucleoside kinase (ribokinase family)